MWHMVLSCTSCFIFMNFWGIFEPFMGFHDSTRFIFEFLLKLAHMSLLKVFMQYLRFFGFLYEQWSKFKVEIVKVGKIMGCLKISSADSPRVRGGRSAIHEAVHQRLCREVLNLKNTLRTVRQRTADGPLVFGSIYQRQFQSGGSVKIQRRTVR